MVVVLMIRISWEKTSSDSPEWEPLKEGVEEEAEIMLSSLSGNARPLLPPGRLLRGARKRVLDFALRCHPTWHM